MGSGRGCKPYCPSNGLKVETPATLRLDQAGLARQALVAAARGLREMTDQKPDGPDWRHVMAREDAHREHDRISSYSDKLNDATFKSGESALRACLLVNGGAAVSVLAFIGGLLSKGLIEDPQQLKPVADSLVPFAWGVSLAVLGMGLSYVVNFLTGLYMNSKKKTWAHPWSEPGDKTWIWGVLRNLTHVVAAPRRGGLSRRIRLWDLCCP
jgi:hypothetical protein